MEINKVCPCTKISCPLHGNCMACIAKHKLKDQMPHCIFPDNNGDRSLKNFYEALKQRFENE